MIPVHETGIGMSRIMQLHVLNLSHRYKSALRGWSRICKVSAITYMAGQYQKHDFGGQNTDKKDILVLVDIVKEYLCF